MKNKEVDSGDIFTYAKKKGYESFICSASGGENVNEVKKIWLFSFLKGCLLK